MRIFDSCIEMLDETYREIWKRGQTIFDATVQGKIVSEEKFEQRELIFYNFRVDNFDDLSEMLNKTRERFNKEHLSIETAKVWLDDMTKNNSLREKWWNCTEYTKDYFSKFCDEGEDKGSYSYGERLIPQIEGLLNRIRKNKYSRGAILPLNIPEDINRFGRRVPCTTAYHFIVRPTAHGDRLNLIIMQRSADAINFFPLDFAKAVLFLKYISKELGIEYGYIIMSINSLHVYAMDVPEEYKW